MSLSEMLARTELQAEFMAGQMLYLAEFGDDPVWRVAARANALLVDIRVLSTLKPTEALTISGCLDALVAQGDGREIDVPMLVEGFAAHAVEYIERSILGALRRLREILETVDAGLEEMGISDRVRPRMVRIGLDFPSSGDGAAYHISRTALSRDAWDIARQRADDYVAHVRYLVRSHSEELLSSDLGLELLLAASDVDRFDLRKRSSLLGPDGTPLSDDHEFTRAHFAHVAEVSDQLLKWLADQPDRLRTLGDRRFEEVVAELLCRRGYDVQLTPAKRDGGRDIHAALHSDLGQFLYFVECKRWQKPVHVDVVRTLHGVVQAEGATAGIVATTSRFTRGAYQFQEKVRWQMSLRDLAALGEWLAVLE
jgi:hypothetical protein